MDMNEMAWNTWVIEGFKKKKTQKDLKIKLEFIVHYGWESLAFDLK